MYVHHWRRVADILKRRLLRSVLTNRNLANFEKKNQDLATIDVQRDIDYPSCAYLGTAFAYMHMRTRVPYNYVARRIFIFGVGFALSFYR